MKEDFKSKNMKKVDVKSFEEMYKKYRKSVLFYIYSIIGKNEDTEDLVQDIFLKVFKSLDYYDENAGSFYNFILMNARQVIINYMKRKAVRNNRRDDSDIELLPDEDFDLEEIFEDKEERYTISKLIGNLSKEQKTAIELFYVKGLSYKEAAEIMNEKESNFKSILHRARNKLKKQMVQKYPELKDKSYKQVIKIVIIVFTCIGLLGGLAYATIKIYKNILNKKQYTISELREDVPDEVSIISRDDAKEKICNYLNILGRDAEISTEDLHLIKDYKLNKICWTIQNENYLMQIDCENGELIAYNDFNIENSVVNIRDVGELYSNLNLPNDYILHSDEKSSNLEDIRFAKKYGDIFNYYESVNITFLDGKLKAIAVTDLPYEDKEVLISKEQAIEILKENGVEVNDVELSIENLNDAVYYSNLEKYDEVDENNIKDWKLYKSNIEIKKVWKTDRNYFVDSNTGEYFEKNPKNLEIENS